MKNLGNKIMVVGVSASGKSTFTRKLAAATQLPPIFVDTIFWKPGWTYIGDEAAAKELDMVSQADKWIIEGYVVPEIKEVLFKRADTIIFLEYSSFLTVFRYIKRWFQHRKDPRPELNGNTERLRSKMIKRIWQKREVRALNVFLERLEIKDKVIRLYSPKETEVFLNQVSNT
jgi:adenylate kinase family enzyme